MKYSTNVSKINLFLLWAVFCSFLLQTTTASSTLSSSTSIPGAISKGRWEDSIELAALEQKVEDYNAKWIASAESHAIACTHRRLICLPLNEKFNPPMGQFAHNHVQTGDKMSVPRNYWKAIEETKAEVPWLMRVQRVPGWTKERFNPSKIGKQKEDGDSDDEDEEEEIVKESSDNNSDPIYQPGDLDTIVGSLLDCRAPANYCFLPWWMMRALGLHPRDVVDVTLATDIAPGSLARLRPHSSDFSKDISNPQAVLETELKHYSSLTRGAVIAFDYNKKRYWFDVEDLRSAPRNEKCDLVKVQDCNLSTDFLVARDELERRLKKKKQRQQQQEP